MVSFGGFLRLKLTLSVVCGLISSGEANSDPYCGQLGCDQAGLFTQDSYKLPTDARRKVAWTSAHPSLVEMNAENQNYGCVGSSKIVVCPYRKEIGGGTRHIMLDTNTGKEYDTSGYETLENVSMPVLTKENLVFAVNASHTSLVDPLNNRSFVTAMPTKNPYGTHSPIYLPNLGFYVVFGNLSLNHSIYNIGKDLATGHSVLNLVTTFTMKKNPSKPCPWLLATEGAVHGNRIYFYAIQSDDSTSYVAVEFFPDAPYYKMRWVLANDESGLSQADASASDNCSYDPSLVPYDTIFPAADVSNQLLATPDGYIIMTAPMALIAIKDHGDSGEQTATSLFGAHFMSLDSSPMAKGKPPIIWMTGWALYPSFRILLSAYNYTSNDKDTVHWYIDLNEELGVPDLNVTSRITTYSDPKDKLRKILVFGVSINSTNTTSLFHTKYCSDCDAGITKLLMAVRTSPNNTMSPDIVWMFPLPTSLNTMEIRGQVIGASNKIIMYITDGKTGKVVALE